MKKGLTFTSYSFIPSLKKETAFFLYEQLHSGWIVFCLNFRMIMELGFEDR